MYPYIRCKCGSPLIGLRYNEYFQLLLDHNNKDPNEPLGPILDSLSIMRDCCRVSIMTNVLFHTQFNGTVTKVPVNRPIKK